jgi:Holliday junction resolvase RusA-like endonuclease
MSAVATAAMSPLTIIVPGSVRGKGRPRFSRASGHAYTDSKTVTAESWVKACALAARGTLPLFEGALGMHVLVTVAIPRSWSKAKQRMALSGSVRPATRPDFDNMLKLIADSLKEIIWHDDAQVVDCSFRKQYGAEPQTVLDIYQLNADYVKPQQGAIV